MLTIIFGITTLVCGIGWLGTRFELFVILWCWQERQLSPPTDEELERAKKEVAKHMAQDLVGVRSRNGS